MTRKAVVSILVLLVIVREGRRPAIHSDSNLSDWEFMSDYQPRELSKPLPPWLSSSPLLLAASMIPATPALSNAVTPMIPRTFQDSELLSLLGVSLSGVTGQVGVTCRPVSVLGAGAGSDCTSQPVSCSKNNFNGVVALACTAINLSL